MSRFLSGEAARLAPYVPGEQPGGGFIKLNTNESPFPPSPAVCGAVTGAAGGLRLYNDPECNALRRAIAGACGLAPAQVLPGNGSDEILAFALRAFCGEGRPALFPDITYGFYEVWAELFGLPVRRVPLAEDFSVRAEDYRGLEGTVLLANPNAPTGLQLPPAEIARILESDPARLVILDEAYADFAPESCLPLLKGHENLLIVRTFSKSRSMAGARLGFALGSEALIADLARIKDSFNPYNVNAMTQAAGIAAIEDDAYFQRCTAEICATRQWAAGELAKLGFEQTDSRANFLFARHPRMQGAAIAAALRQKRILVRRWDAPRIRDWLRISVGSRQEMETLIGALGEILGQTGGAAGHGPQNAGKEA